MKVRRIYSRNADFQLLTALRENRNKRHREGAFLVEGVRNINAAIERGWTIRALAYTPDLPLSMWARQHIDNAACEVHYQCSAELMAALSDKQMPSELLAVVEMRTLTLDDIGTGACPLVALFDRPSNRGNLGSVMRSCDGFGVDALVLTGHAVDAYDPETVVASMGSFFALQVARVEDASDLEKWLLALRERHPGFQVVGTSSHGTLPINEVDLGKPTLLLIGNETDGLSHRLVESSDVLATIPMAKSSAASSFNVAAAATVLFYEAQRQRTVT